MNRNAILPLIVSLCWAKIAVAQPALPKDFSQKKDSIVIQCNDKIVKSVSDFDALSRKMPGLTIGTDWEGQDPGLLVDQDKIPSREEREKIYTALAVKIGCAQQLEAIGKPIMHESMIAFIDASNYLGNYRFAKLLSQPTTYGEFNESRRKSRNAYLSDLSEMLKLLQNGTQDAVTKTRNYVDKAEEKLTNALNENEQLSNTLKSSGKTYCRKLGAFDYCEKP